MAPLAGMSGGDIEVLRCADYTLRTCRSSKSVELVGGFGGDGAGGGADDEPFGGAGDAAKGAAAACDLKGVVPLLGERGGLGFFIGEIGLRGG